MVVRPAAPAAAPAKRAGGAIAMQEARSTAHQRRQATPRRVARRAPAAGAASAASLLLPLALLLGAASAIGPALPSNYRVLHANVILRHGERTRLVKTAGEYEFGVSDDVVLTTKGENDCYGLGAQLRERYMPDAAASILGVTTTIQGLTLWYDPDRVQIESSGYDRTIESATALAFGLYPMGQTDADLANNTLLLNNQIVAPVKSSKPDNDAYILGFDKCPVYDENWIESYLDEDFVELQDQATAGQGANGQYDDYVTQVFNLFQMWQGGDSTPVCFFEAKEFFQNKLEEHAPYNLWDCAKTADAEGDTTAVDIIMEAAVPPGGLVALGLDTSVEHEFQGFHYLEFLVDEIEDRKYQQKVVGRMAGGLYITAMHTRMTEVVDHMLFGETEDTGRFPGMHITSGHYGTLKGIAGALDIGGLYGIPEFSSHLTFELLYNEELADSGEEAFAVRILYQEGTETDNLDFVQMGVVFDGSGSVSLDDALASKRDFEHGIMPWPQWVYLMSHQVEGGPAIYSAEDVEEAWCLDCLATETNSCLKLELRLMTEKWEEAEIQTTEALEDKEAVDDGVGSTHVALVSVFGLILGIGVGICIKPCVDRHNKSVKSASGAISGDRGLEAWSSSAGSNNGSFRLGAKNTSTRHVMGAVASNQMVAVPTADYDDVQMNGGAPYGGAAHANGNGTRYDVEEDAGGSSIPEFAPTSALGEPVPFPHRRQPSGMVTGVDSSMMTGIDAEDDGEEDDIMGATTSRAGDEEAGSTTTSTATTKIEAEAGVPSPAEDMKEDVANNETVSTAPTV